jgi:CIC family chloride channel protein
MSAPDVSESSTTEGLPVAPSMAPAIHIAQVPRHPTLVDSRVLFISGICIGVGALVAFVAQALTHLIYFFTNLCFYGKLSFGFAMPFDNQLGWYVVLVPVGGALVIGLIARFWLESIRGDGIPEAMEKVLVGKSTIPPLMTLLKPLSAAISIGTGGPFGAEGPIIASGGALGSLCGQMLNISAAERKTLLSAGAAAGIAAAFGSPVAAVLLAIEILLFELRPQSLIPVALACATAAGLRMIFDGTDPVFPMDALAGATGPAIFAYSVHGLIIGAFAALVTAAVYRAEELFDHLPVHWMWWPAIGAVVVGVIGYYSPRTLGVGYVNITDFLAQNKTLSFIVILSLLKFVSWTVALASGTSGGTLAPLFTIGGGIGVVLGVSTAHLFPEWGVDVRMAALVGMAAMFAGTSRAVLASIVFACEATHQVNGLLPLLAGCFSAYLVSCLLMRNSIMSEKIVRRGVRVPTEYMADALEQILVCDVMHPSVVFVKGEDTVKTIREWFNQGIEASSHQGFPVLTASGVLAGVITRKDLGNPKLSESMKIIDILARPPVVVYSDCTLRAATDHMVNHNIGRLPVILREQPKKIVGIITRSDILTAHRRRIDEHNLERARIKIPILEK